jgi:hypothetical protein
MKLYALQREPDIAGVIVLPHHRTRMVGARL